MNTYTLCNRSHVDLVKVDLALSGVEEDDFIWGARRRLHGPLRGRVWEGDVPPPVQSAEALSKSKAALRVYCAIQNSCPGSTGNVCMSLGL